MMKCFYICIALVLLSFNAQAVSFIEGLEDIPILNGMKQTQKDSISFGNAESRLVEAYLTSNKVGFKKVETFYKQTLPQMGWIYQGRRENTIVFEREGEILDIAKESNNPLLVRITVKSKI